MADTLSALKNCELFQGISDNILLEHVLPCGHVQEYQKGQFLVIPLQRLEHLGLILSGKVQILHIFADGHYSLMNVLDSEDILAIDLVCTKKQLSPYHAMATANVQIFWIPVTLVTQPGRLREADRLHCLHNMLLLIADENMKKEYRLAILSQKGLRERIISYLMMQSSRRRKTTFAISFSREELAAYLCVNRSALSHELSLMEEEGLISFRKNVFSLRSLAEQNPYLSL